MERTMLGISLGDRIGNTDIRRKRKVKDIVEKVAELKWRWAGNVARMEEGRWSKKALQWPPRQFIRSRGRLDGLTT
jgi:hypothetical protein